MNATLAKLGHSSVLRIDRDIGRKSPLMLAFVIALWLGPLALYGPRLLRIVTSSTAIAEFIVLLAYSFMLVIFWLLAAYYISVVIFAALTRNDTPRAALMGEHWPAVALLYPTCNDFQLEAITTCLNQDYPDFHVFLLDDSTRQEYRDMADAFQAAHPDKTTVVRRSDRQGYKAGNLNHALRGPAATYPLFAVVDADERLPEDFLHRAVPHAVDPRTAFVQANHAPNPKQTSMFSVDIGPTILPFWDVHCRPRNRFGFVVFVGHGAVVRYDAWKVVGGFPEIVTEDLGFSALLAQNGLRGVYLPDLLCFEDFPSNYSAFKRQQERYVVGSTQALGRFLWPLVKSKQVSLVEKLDFCLWCTPLYVPALCLLYALICVVGLPLVFGRWEDVTFTLFGHELILHGLRILDRQLAPLWLIDFQLYSVLVALAPALASVMLGMQGKLRLGRLLLLSTAPYLSLMIVSWRGILGYLVFGRTLWPPTGESAQMHPASSGTSSGRSAAAQMEWKTRRVTVQHWEVGVGLTLAAASLLSFNLALFAVSCCLLIGRWIELTGWERLPVRIAIASCFILIVAQMVINVLMLFESPGVVPLVFSVHF